MAMTAEFSSWRPKSQSPWALVLVTTATKLSRLSSRGIGLSDGLMPESPGENAMRITMRSGYIVTRVTAPRTPWVAMLPQGLLRVVAVLIRRPPRSPW